MFQCREYKEILKGYTNQTKLPKDMVIKLKADRAEAMSVLVKNEISSDCCFDIDDLNCLYKERMDSQHYMLVARSGQGDEWLLQFDKNVIWFLDHDCWEEARALTCMQIGFEQFVVMADLLKQYETIETPTSKDIKSLMHSMCEIHQTLPTVFPFSFC